MTQGELSRRVGCHKSTISLILSGNREAGKSLALRLMAEIPGTRLMDWLFARQNRIRLKAAIRKAK